MNLLLALVVLQFHPAPQLVDMAEGYAAARQITSPFRLPPSLAAPKAQPPPSTIPTDRLATQADHWADGRGVSPALPPPNGYTLQPKPASTSLTTHATQILISQASHVAAQQQQQQEPQQPLSLQVQPTPMNGYNPPPPQYSQSQQTGGYYATPQPYQSQSGIPPVSVHDSTPVPYFALPRDVRTSQQYGGHMPINGAYPQHSVPSISLPQQYPQHPQAFAAPVLPSQMLVHQSTIPPNNYYSTQQSTPASPENSYPLQHTGGSFIQGPPRSTSTVTENPIARLDQLSLVNDGRRYAETRQPNYYTHEQDGPPHKLSVTHPDQRTLTGLRETAYAPPSDMNRKIAWAKQVLKFVERQQAIAGDSSRITDQTLVRWTDEALNLVLSSAASQSPVPLALYLRGELSSSGSFPSYRSKDTNLAFRDFEAAANSGLVKAWFRIGRAYEDFGDNRRAVGAYERGVEKGDCGSTYRLAMAYLLGQIGVTADAGKALTLLRRAADAADVDTPQPPYILGLILNGEFESVGASTLSRNNIPLNPEEAKWRIERAAFLALGTAQYKMGYAYEYATMGCLFDPLLSVQYYALASQNGEVEADMALSKWYLCGSDGNFDKNEALAVTFAEKAAHRGLPSAEFALGYFSEVGISGPINLDLAMKWYHRAASHGNDEAQQRLEALRKSETNVLSRTDHESQLDQKLVRKRTQAQARSEEQRSRLASTYARSQANQYSPSPEQGFVASQSAPAPLSASSANGHAQAQSRPSPSSQSYNQNGPVRTRTRSDTLKQVEAAAAQAAGFGPRPMPNRNPATTTPATTIDKPSIPQVSTPGRHSLQDLSAASNGPKGSTGTPRRPASSLPPSTTAPIPSDRPEIPTRMGSTKPTTFAEMGITTTKAKKDDCLIM